MSILGSLLGGGSNRPEPSETMQNNAGGLMSKFNPFNLVSGMFGGRKAGAADNYAKTSNGMKKSVGKKDPKFTSKQARSETPLKKGDSATDIAAKIYDLYRVSEKKEEKEQRKKEVFEKSMEKVREKRNKELIDALITRPKGLEKQTKDIKKETNKIKAETKDIKKESGISKPTAQPPVTTAKPPTAQPPVTTAKPPTAQAVPRQQPPAAQAVPRQQPPAAAPKPQPPAAAAPKPSLATKIVPPLVAGTVAASVASRIAARESAGESPESYYIMNIWSQKDKSKPQDVKDSYKVKKGNLNVVTGKPYEKDLTEMNLGEVIELARSRARYFNSSGAGAAAGKYQFMPDTLKGLAQQKLGTGWEKEKFTPEMQEFLMGSIMNNYAKALIAAGVPITPASLYMMHFVGNAKKTKAIIESPDNTSMSTILGAAGTRANPSVAKLTTKEYKQSIAKKGLDFQVLDPKEFVQPKRPVQNVSFSISTGSVLAEKSEELKNSKQQAAVSSPIVVNNNNNIVASNAPTQTMVQPKSDASRFVQGARV